MANEDGFIRRAVEVLCQLDQDDDNENIQENDHDKAAVARAAISLEKFSLSISRVGGQFGPLLATLWTERLQKARAFLSAPEGTLQTNGRLRRLRHVWYIFNMAAREIAAAAAAVAAADAPQAWAGPTLLKSLLVAVAAVMRESCLPFACFGLKERLAGEVLRYRQDPDSFQLEDLERLQTEIELLQYPGFEHLQAEYVRLLEGNFDDSVEPMVSECCLAFEKLGSPVLEGVSRSMERSLEVERFIDRLHGAFSWRSSAAQLQQPPPHLSPPSSGLGFAARCADSWLAHLRSTLPHLLHLTLLRLVQMPKAETEAEAGEPSSSCLKILRQLLETAEVENSMALCLTSLSDALKTLLRMAPKEPSVGMEWFLSVFDALHLACATLVPEDPPSRLSSVFSPVVKELFQQMDIDISNGASQGQTELHESPHNQRCGSLPGSTAFLVGPPKAFDLSAALALHIDQALRARSATTYEGSDRLGSMLVMMHMAPPDGQRHCLLAALRLLRLDLKAMKIKQEKEELSRQKPEQSSSFAGPVGSLWTAWKASSEAERPALGAALAALGADVQALQREEADKESFAAVVNRPLPPHEDLFRQFLQSELGPTHRSFHHLGEVAKDVSRRGIIILSDHNTCQEDGSFQASICAEASARSLGLTDLFDGQPSLSAAVPGFFRSSQPLSEMKNQWCSKYAERFSHRRLRWCPLLGTALMQWKREHDQPVELLVSELQAHILLLFNLHEEIAEADLRMAEAEWEGETALALAKAKSWQLALEGLLHPEGGPLERSSRNDCAIVKLKSSQPDFPQRPSEMDSDSLVDLAGLWLLAASDSGIAADAQILASPQPPTASSPWCRIVGCPQKNEDKGYARSADERNEGTTAILEAGIVRLLKRWRVLTFDELLEKLANYSEGVEAGGAQRVAVVTSQVLKSVSGATLATRLKNLHDRELLTISGDLDAFDLERNPSTRIEYVP